MNLSIGFGKGMSYVSSEVPISPIVGKEMILVKEPDINPI